MVVITKYLTNQSSWKTLDSSVMRILHYHKDLALFLESKPISREGVQELERSSVLRFAPLQERGLYGCFSRYDTFCYIEVDESLKPFERDVVLMHELVHVWYGRQLDDAGTGILQQRNFLLVEWVARQWRADPMILRSVIDAFSLEAFIYDNASSEAFSTKAFAKTELFVAYETIMDL